MWKHTHSLIFGCPVNTNLPELPHHRSDTKYILKKHLGWTSWLCNISCMQGRNTDVLCIVRFIRPTSADSYVQSYTIKKNLRYNLRGFGLLAWTLTIVTIGPQNRHYDCEQHYPTMTYSHRYTETLAHGGLSPETSAQAAGDLGPNCILRILVGFSG